MKKLISFLLVSIICFSLCSCGNTTEAEISELSSSDNMYINSVYKTMSDWDTTHTDGGVEHHINKIAFYDFDGTDRIVFYKNYPIAGYCGSGYDVLDDGLKKLSFDIYD